VGASQSLLCAPPPSAPTPPVHGSSASLAVLRRLLEYGQNALVASCCRHINRPHPGVVDRPVQLRPAAGIGAFFKKKAHRAGGTIYRCAEQRRPVVTVVMVDIDSCLNQQFDDLGTLKMRSILQHNVQGTVLISSGIQ
jgi:hypothetical protein